MSDLLSDMARSSRRRWLAAARVEPLEALRERALALPEPSALQLSGFDLIAEVKLRAPSVGVLASEIPDEEAFVAARARAYADGGAAAISVLTEPERFDGAPSHLAAVVGAMGTAGPPVMRKDFLVDPYQIWEARAWGAGGVLLIVRMLEPARLEAMVEAAAHAGLFLLLEAFDEADLRRAGLATAGVPGALVGVNTRDLVSLEVDGTRLARLAEHLPPGLPAVAESGLRRPEDAARVAGLGYRAALVGSALMASPDPARLVRELREAGRAACR